MKYILLFILTTLTFLNSQQSANANELFTTEVSNFRIGAKIFRIWASTRNSGEPSTRKQFRYDPLFMPIFDSDGNLAMRKVKVNNNWRVQLTILLDSPYAASEAFKVLQQTYPEEKQLQSLNVFAKSIKSISITLPELANHPGCKLLRRTINFHKPENQFLLIIECPTEELANNVITSLPNYRVLYDLSVNSFLSVKNRISVNMKVLQNSNLLAELDGLAKNGKAYIHRKDMRTLLDNIQENLAIDAVIEDPKTFTDDFLNRIIHRYFKRVNIQRSGFDDEKWKSTYNADDLKPDVIQKSLNKFFEKDNQTGHWKVSKNGSAEVKGSIFKIFSGSSSVKGSYTRDELQKKLRELDITISFEGNKIIAKSIGVYRVNLNKLQNDSSSMYMTTKLRPMGIQIQSALSIDLARYQQSKEEHFDLAKRVQDLENAVNNLQKDNNLQQQKLDSLEIVTESLEASTLQNTQYRILAVVRVDSHKVTYATPGVSFSKSSGVVTFPNPKEMKFVPVISNSLNSSYLTEVHFVRQISLPNQFRVWRTALDTGNRNNKPHSFTAIVIGIEK